MISQSYHEDGSAGRGREGLTVPHVGDPRLKSQQHCQRALRRGCCLQLRDCNTVSIIRFYVCKIIKILEKDKNSKNNEDLLLCFQTKDTLQTPDPRGIRFQTNFYVYRVGKSRLVST